MSHHYSGPDYGFPHGDARLDLTDLYAFPKPGVGLHIIYVNAKGLPTLKKGARYRMRTEPFSLMTFTSSRQKKGLTSKATRKRSHDGQRCKEVCNERRMGLPSLGWRRSIQTAGS